MDSRGLIPRSDGRFYLTRATDCVGRRSPDEPFRLRNGEPRTWHTWRMPNPFFEGRAAGKYFVGRGTETTQLSSRIAELLQDAPNHVQVAGMFGTGKTSLLHKAIGMAEEHKIYAARIEVPEMAEGAALAQAQHILRTLLSKMEDDGVGREQGFRFDLLHDWEKGNSGSFEMCKATALSGDDLARDLRRIAHTLEEFGYHGLLCLLDEAQYLQGPTLRAIKSALFETNSILMVIALRVLTDVPSVDVVAEDMLTLLDDSINRLFSTRIGLGPFEHGDGERCIQRRLADDTDGISFESEVVSDIVHITRGIPHHVIGLAHLVYDLAAVTPDRTASQDHLLSAVKSRFRLEWKSVSGLLDSASPDERDALAALAEHPQVADTADLVALSTHSLTDREIESQAVLWSDYFDRLQEIYPEWCRVSPDGVALDDPVVAYILRQRLRFEDAS